MECIEQFLYEEKRSKFYCYKFIIHSREDIKQIITDLKNEHRKAKHILRACRYQNNGGIYIIETNENQEPISSMKKIGSIMEKKDVRDCGIFIVRYFGGTKLGASHLDHLYFDLGLKLLVKDA